jgi:hypothetical protein
MKILDIHVAKLRKLEEILSPIKGADIELRGDSMFHTNPTTTEV